MRFADVDTDGITVDGDAEDRVLFHVIETRNEVGDLPVDEAWTILADRYPDDARLRILAWFHDLSANGVDALRDPTAIVKSLQHLIDKVGATPEVSSLIVMAGVEITNRDLMVPLEKAAAPLPEERIARRTLRKLASAVLDEAEEKTRDGKPFGDARKEEKVPVATGPLRDYSPKTAFDVGDRVSHPKFGEGIVLSKAEGKIEVAFPDARRRLISA
jgi:hypothetical protein